MKQWKQIREAPDYEISDSGDIRRLNNSTSGKRGRLLKPRYTEGYRTACLCISGVPKYFRVHRLVMSNFVKPLDALINHKNGKRHDNRLSNLEYCTPLENVRHSINTLGNSYTGSCNPNAKINEEMVKTIFRMKADGATQVAISKDIGMSKANVCRILGRKMWAHVSIGPHPSSS